MAPLFHIVRSADWAAAQQSGEYAPPSLASEGFIHLSAEHQVAGTLGRFYAGVPDLCLLVLDESALGSALCWEEGEPGELFPHLYRALTLDEVLEVRPVQESWEVPGTS